jgi:Family of unknown function (DUF5317)
MLPQLLPAVCVALVARAAGGSFAGLTRPIAWWPLGLASILVQVALPRSLGPDMRWFAPFAHWLWVVAIIAVLAVLCRNAQLEQGPRRLVWALAAAGVALNLTVIVANGGYMPVSLDALAQTGQLQDLAQRAFRRDIPVDDTTRLVWLADVLPDPVWMPHPVVWSIGDRILAAGLAGWAFVSVWAGRSQAARASA